MRKLKEVPKKERICPVQETISSEQCATQRSSSFGCPLSCEYYPYNIANYDTYIEAEKLLNDTVINLVNHPPDMSKHEVAIQLFQLEMARINACCQSAPPDYVPRDLLQRWLCYNLVFGYNGLWEEWEGKQRLKHDTQVIGSFYKTIQCRFLKIGASGKAPLTQVTDILTGESFLLADKTMYGVLPEGKILLGNCLQTPGFLRPQGGLILIPTWATPSIVKFIDSNAKRLNITKPQYVNTYFPEVLLENYKASRHPTTNLTTSTVVYGFQELETYILRTLLENPQIRSEDTHIFLTSTKTPTLTEGITFLPLDPVTNTYSLGVVTLKDNKLRFASVTKEFFQEGKDFLTQLFGERISFESELTIDPPAFHIPKEL